MVKFNTRERNNFRLSIPSQGMTPSHALTKASERHLTMP